MYSDDEPLSLISSSETEGIRDALEKLDRVLVMGDRKSQPSSDSRMVSPRSLSYSDQRSLLKSLNVSILQEKADSTKGPLCVEALFSGDGRYMLDNSRVPFPQKERTIVPSISSRSITTPEIQGPVLPGLLQKRLVLALAQAGRSMSAALTMSIVELDIFLRASRTFSSDEIDKVLIYFEYQALR